MPIAESLPPDWAYSKRDRGGEPAWRYALRMREGLHSLPRLLRDHGYTTAAYVANWTLKDKITGLAEHFDDVLGRTAKADIAGDEQIRWEQLA